MVSTGKKAFGFRPFDSREFGRTVRRKKICDFGDFHVGVPSISPLHTLNKFIEFYTNGKMNLYNLCIRIIIQKYTKDTIIARRHGM